MIVNIHINQWIVGGTMAKILIVDDDAEIATLLDTILSLAGFDTVVINDSTQAMEAAESMQPDLFILDLMMPEPNGFELCRMIRSNPNLINRPIIIITAMDNDDSKSIAHAAGANDYIVKPFDQEELPKRINLLLNTGE
jgi:DNA-binding response OmpR family regulator